MKLFKFYPLAFLALLFLMFNSNASGPGAAQGVDRTGSPVGSGSCNSCHSGGNFGTQVALSLRKDGQNVTQYEPGESYTLRVTINTTNSPQAYGFQAVALVNNDNSNAGTFGSVPSGTQITTIQNRNYFEHSSPRNSNNVEIEWTAPAAGTGEVRFYAAGNAVNRNGSESGDQPDVLDQPLAIAEASVSGLFEIKKLDVNLRVYPNPATNWLRMEVAGAEKGRYQMQVIDVTGRVAVEQSIDIAESQFVKSFPVSDLKPGQYFLRLTDGQAVSSKPFLKW